MQAVLLIGTQGSGKSSFFKERFADTHVRINLDMLKTRNRERILLSACIQAQQSFVIDNTNPTRVDRKRYFDLLRDTRFEITGYFLQSRLEDCLARNQLRTGKQQIPEAGIRSTHSRLEIPSPDEGFQQLFFVRLDNNTFIVEPWHETR